MQLFEVPMSPNCKKIRICANELDLPLELVAVNPREGQNRTPEYLAKNPMGKVPTLVDGDYSLWESGAIMAYLAMKKPERGLLPSEPRAHADVLRWMLWHSIHVEANVTTLAIERVFKKMRGQPGDDPNLIKGAEEQLARFLPVLEEQLQAREFVIGHLSIADIAMGTTLEGAERYQIDLKPYPHIRGWLSRLQARESWKKATIA